MKTEKDEERLLTILPSPLDNRDWVGDTIYHPALYIPQNIDFRETLQPVRDQGEYGTCAAQSAACMKEWQEKEEAKKLEESLEAEKIEAQKNEQDLKQRSLHKMRLTILKNKY